MIHICMALYDNNGTFSKYMGVTIISIFCSTKEKVTVHIIHDETLSIHQRKKFDKLAKLYNQKIIFHRVRNYEYSMYETVAKAFSIGTLFRLSVCDVLPAALDKVIYLDADIIVNLDIKSLWDVDVCKYPLAAVRDGGISEFGVNPWPCRKKKVQYQRYFNAGVLILNLNFLRRIENFKEKCLQYILQNPQSSYLDQDALNIFFSESYLELDIKYNLISKTIRKHNLPEHPCIVHLAGDYINYEEPRWWDMLFMKYWRESPWKDEIADFFLSVLAVNKRRFDVYRLLLSKMSRPKVKKIIWGINSILWDRVSKIITMDEKKDYAVDNNSLLWNKKVNGVIVINPDKLLQEDSEMITIIVLSLKYYAEIKQQLEKYGLIENIHFFNGQLLLSQVDGGLCGYY